MYSRGVNQWSDLTQAEWEENYLGGYKRLEMSEKGAKPSERNSRADLPEAVDWRNQGVITAVKNQGACGSCWAFAATEQIESYAALASGDLVELSTQQMVFHSSEE